MTAILPYYTTLLLIFLFLVFLVSAFRQKKQPKETTKSEPKIISKSRNDEILDSLQFMLEHQIITVTEYNQLLVKCLPFLKG